MKKIISAILITSLVCCMISESVLAANTIESNSYCSENQVTDLILESSEGNRQKIYSCTDSDGLIEIYAQENSNGVTTITQTQNGIIEEEIDTVAGSGMMRQKKYKNGKLKKTDIIVTSEQNISQTNNTAISLLYLSSDRNVITLKSNGYGLPLGTMTYNGTSKITITCTYDSVINLNSSYTIHKGLSESITYVIGALVSVLLVPAVFAEEVVQGFIAGGILTKAAGKIVNCVATRTVSAVQTSQTIYGKVTSTAHNGKSGKLYGDIYVATYKNKAGKKISKTYKEGYTVSLWKTGELGRQMFYKCIGTEYTPTSWTTTE